MKKYLGICLTIFTALIMIISCSIMPDTFLVKGEWWANKIYRNNGGFVIVDSNYSSKDASELWFSFSDNTLLVTERSNGNALATYTNYYVVDSATGKIVLCFNSTMTGTNGVYFYTFKNASSMTLTSSNIANVEIYDLTKF